MCQQHIIESKYCHILICQKFICSDFLNKMFRKAKPKLSPPSPPTIEQILEDLETFQVEKPDIEKIRSYNPSTQNSQSVGSPTEINAETVAEWWKTFETFQTDIHDLHKMRRNFNIAKNELSEASNAISSKSNKIKEKIDKSLANVREIS